MRASAKGARAAAVDRVAREALGIDELRPPQRRAVEAAVSGRDVLAVLPTGFGKSAIYQVVGAMIDGPTVVVSPLLALQYDQVVGLAERAAGEARAANSATARGEFAQILDAFGAGELEFLFVAPEQLTRPETLDAVRAGRPSVFVVDEAHCISSWGHDFRPDYLRLGDVVEALGHPVVIALTATAAPPVRQEIVERLRLRDPEVIVHDFDRPNIRLAVERFVDAASRDEALVDRAAEGEGAGIVYVATRKRTEALAEALVARGSKARPYHAGLPAREREAAQEAFMHGDVDVVVATTAFGMGIDKPDVRFVLHGDPPESLDAYYQEIGRAGRDGEPAEAVLFYRPEDLGLRRYLGASGKVNREHLDAVAAVLGGAGGGAGTTVADIAAAASLSARRATLTLAALADEGGVSVDADGWVTPGTPDEVGAAVEAAVAAAEARDQLDTSRLEMVRGYAEAAGCRRRALLTYFAEPFDDDCGRCDTCEARSDAGSTDQNGAEPFPAGRRVRHAEWGEGQVLRTEGDTLVVLFDDVGYKTLSTELVLGAALLESI